MNNTIILTPEQKIERVERTMRYLRYEMGICFDEDGNIIFKVNGHIDNVDVPADKARSLWNKTWSHNHVKGYIAPLSEQDMQLAAYLNMQEIRAVSIDALTGKALISKMNKGDLRYWPMIEEKSIRALVLDEYKILTKIYNRYERVNTSYNNVWSRLASIWNLSYSAIVLTP